MQKNSVVEAYIVKQSHDGRGIAKVDGKTVFVEGALPSETVTFVCTKSKKDYAEGRLQTIINASPERVLPACSHYGVCGGCSLQHLSPQMQIQSKQEQLLDLLSRIGHVTPKSVLPVLQADTYHYRTKARLSARYVEKKGAFLLGFREKFNARLIAEIEGCKILDARVDALIMPLRTLFLGFEARADIAQVEVAASEDHLALIIRNLSPLGEADHQKLLAFGERYDLRLYLQPAGPNSVVQIYPPKDHAFHGEDLTYTLPSFGLTYHFSPMDFTQVNMSLNRLMVERAVTLLELDESDIVLDLFCGLGNFSLALATVASQVIGIEGSEEMVERARSNAAFNQLTNCEFYAANLFEPGVLSSYAKRGITKLLIDPPRAGALEIVKEIEHIAPSRIVYVSCDPATLARDTDILVNQKGYTLLSAGVMDMFSHTAHVESIAVFSRSAKKE